MDIIDYDYDFIVSLLMSSDPTNYEVYKSFKLPHDVRLKVWRRFMDELEYLMPYKIDEYAAYGRSLVFYYLYYRTSIFDIKIVCANHYKNQEVSFIVKDKFIYPHGIKVLARKYIVTYNNL